MKHFSRKCLIAVATILVSHVFANKVIGESLFFGKTMSPLEAKQIWGEVKINSTKFRQGDLGVRSSMAFSVVSQKSKYIGKSPREIRDIFGECDGHYVNEAFPAYVLSPRSKNSKRVWQLVFVLGRDLRIDDVVIFSRNGQGI